MSLSLLAQEKKITRNSRSDKKPNRALAEAKVFVRKFLDQPKQRIELEMEGIRNKKLQGDRRRSINPEQMRISKPDLESNFDPKNQSDIEKLYENLVNFSRYLKIFTSSSSRVRIYFKCL